MDFKFEVSTENKSQRINVNNKKYIDRFLLLRYEEIYKRLRVLDKKIDGKSYTPSGILNDTIIALYEYEKDWESWEEAERFLNRKFKIKKR